MIWRVCLTRSFGVGLRTMVVTTHRHFIQPCAIWTSAWQAGRWRNTNACDDIGEGHSNGCARLRCATPDCLLIGQCCITRRLDDKSRMSGDVPVRICERLGVRLPRATRRNIYVSRERVGKRGMESIPRFVTAKLKLKVNQSKSAVAQPKDRKFLRVQLYGRQGTLLPDTLEAAPS